MYHQCANPAFFFVIQNRGLMFDGVNQAPAFIDHFVLVKANDFIQIAPSGKE
jgi:hypothetical protein